MVNVWVYIRPSLALLWTSAPERKLVKQQYKPKRTIFNKPKARSADEESAEIDGVSMMIGVPQVQVTLSGSVPLRRWYSVCLHTLSLLLSVTLTLCVCVCVSVCDCVGAAHNIVQGIQKARAER